MSHIPTRGIVAHSFWQRWLIIILHHRQHYGDLVVADPGTSWIAISNYYFFPFDFTNIKPSRLGFLAGVKGTEAGTKGIRIYNVTDAKAIASTTWTGSATTMVSALGDVRTLTGIKELRFQWYASSLTEDLTLRWLILIIDFERK